MKSKRSRKDKALRKRSSINKLTIQFMNRLIKEIYDSEIKAEDANKKTLDECPTIGMFRVRKNFNDHESVEL